MYDSELLGDNKKLIRFFYLFELRLIIALLVESCFFYIWRAVKQEFN
jgi:hypothetical protein